MRVEIKEFSGPLDLLLQLIRREEMDIFDIDIHKITEQYLTFIKENSITDLDSAGDFIRIAALLIYIKSKSLFPSESPEDPETESEDDLQKALTQSLLKMSAVQNICKELRQYPMMNRDVWSSGGQTGKDLSAFFPEAQQTGIKQQPILKLMRAYRQAFQSESSPRPAVSFKDPLPFLTDCIRAIQQNLIKGSSLKMSALTKKKDKHILSHVLVTFLALLELSKLGIVSLAQDKDFSDVMVFVKKHISERDFQSLRETEEQERSWTTQ